MAREAGLRYHCSVSRQVACRSRLGLALFAVCSAAGAQQSSAPSSVSFEAALREADRRFVAGDLQGALAVLQPACADADSAECAFSLGAIQHGLGHCPEALAHYRRYVQLAPQGEHRADVTAALEEVESRCGSATGSTPAAATTSEPVASTDEPRALNPALEPDGRREAELASPPAAVEPSALGGGLTTAAFVVSGVAAVSSAVFGILAARSARRCARADVYDQRFIDECEGRGPRYQGLWQGFAVASGAFLGVGVALWWSDSSAAAAGVSDTGLPGLALHGQF
ncbi:MAG: hypothetical protein RL685_3162 [Pseudomonadota bacterium]|jgi:hypothetical protein